VRGKPAIAKIHRYKNIGEIAAACRQHLPGLPTHIPTGVGIGTSGTICFSPGIENAIYEMAKKQTLSPRRYGTRPAVVWLIPA
jgi:hypothetical protein